MTTAIKTFVGLLNEHPTTKGGVWIYTEETKTYENGASIRIRGYKCSRCGNFIHIKGGIKNYCDNCGAKMSKEGNV